MIRLLGKVPRKVTVAVSGGVDSMVLLNFLNKNHEVSVAFYHHGTENSERALEFLNTYCVKNSIEINVGFNKEEKPSELSWEEWWRNKRYQFLSQFDTVVTGHNLDDVVETWIWSSLHGRSSLIPYRRCNVIRPFLLNKKQELITYAKKQGVLWIEDHSNSDVRYTRNYIRHELMPGILKVNSGIHSMLRKKLVKRGVD